MKGKIVLIRFPFTNLTSSKRRPALVLLEKDFDVVVAFISSKIPVVVDENIVIINKTHKEFNLTGLKVDSVISLDKVATLSKRLISGELGEIGTQLKSEVNNHFRKIYHL